MGDLYICGIQVAGAFEQPSPDDLPMIDIHRR
jgi:hypothetical protein